MRSPLIVSAIVLLTFAAPRSAPGEGQAKPAHPAAGYESRARKELDELGARIDAIQRRARADGEKSHERAEAQLRKVRADREKAEGFFRKLEGTATEAGRGAKADLERTIRDLKRACRDLERDLGIGRR